MKPEIINQMFKIYYDIVPEYKGKVWIPISGGLDSKLVAAICKLKGIKFGSHHFVGQNKENIKSVERIWDILGVEDRIITTRSEFIGKYGDRFKDYTIVVPEHCATITGMQRFKQGQRVYFSKTINKEHAWSNSFYKCFGNVEHPTEDIRWVGYCMSLPYSYRFMQRAYIEMINKYFPELAEVPRCFETFGEPIRHDKGLGYYTLMRLSRRLNADYSKDFYHDVYRDTVPGV